MNTYELSFEPCSACIDIALAASQRTLLEDGIEGDMIPNMVNGRGPRR